MTRGVDRLRFQPEKRQAGFFDRYRLNGGLKFLYVGRISREKDVDRLADAFDGLWAKGHTAGLVFVGDGPYRKELQARCRDHSVTFTGAMLAASGKAACSFCF